MIHLTHRFSSLTSLTMLLVLSIGTAWMFSFAAKTQTFIEGIYEQSAVLQDDAFSMNQPAYASSSLSR